MDPHQKTGTPVLQRQAGSDEIVEPGEERAPGRTHCSTLKRVIKRRDRDFLCRQIMTGQQAMVLN